MHWQANSLTKLVSTLQDELLRSYKLIPQIGYELEFYITEVSGQQISSSKILQIQKIFSEKIASFEQEKGQGQFEIKGEPKTNLVELSENFLNLKNNLQVITQDLGLMVNFDAKPYSNDYGSSIHVHLNFLNNKNENVFSKDAINDNLILKQVIYGILDIICEGIYFFSVEQDFKRFDHKYMAPTNVSWGGNNRTTAIRIPDAKPENRRIEFRVPSSQNSLKKIIAFILIGALHGLKNKDLFYERIYGNAFDGQYSLKSFPEDLKKAEEVFYSRGVLRSYLEHFHFTEV